MEKNKKQFRYNLLHGNAVKKLDRITADYKGQFSFYKRIYQYNYKKLALFMETSCALYNFKNNRNNFIQEEIKVPFVLAHKDDPKTEDLDEIYEILLRNL